MQTSRKCLSKVGISLQRLHKDIGDTIQIKKLSDSMEIIPFLSSRRCKVNIMCVSSSPSFT